MPHAMRDSLPWRSATGSLHCERRTPQPTRRSGRTSCRRWPIRPRHTDEEPRRPPWSRPPCWERAVRRRRPCWHACTATRHTPRPSFRMAPAARMPAPRAAPGPEKINPEADPLRRYGVTRADIAAFNGGVLLRLGRADQAVGPLAEGVRQLDGSMVRDRQLYLTDWAEALARPGR